MNSLRVLSSSKNAPPNLDVVIDEFTSSTPLALTQKWSASINTATSSVPKINCNALKICSDNLSCTCGLRLKKFAIRFSFDNPTTYPVSGFGMYAI